jgi:hypothetical protein
VARLTVHLAPEQSTKTDEELWQMIDNPGDLLHALDALFSHIRGVQTGFVANRSRFELSGNHQLQIKIVVVQV